MNKFFTLELALEFYEISKNLKFPSHLKDQYLRACSSIALNLSEGSAKPTIADRRKFYFIALGSLRECQTLLKLHGRCDLLAWQKSRLFGRLPVQVVSECGVILEALVPGSRSLDLVPLIP